MASLTKSGSGAPPSLTNKTESRQGKLVYHSTTETVTTETVLEAFDLLLKEKSPEAFAVVVLDNASIHRSALFKSKELDSGRRTGSLVID